MIANRVNDWFWFFIEGIIIQKNTNKSFTKIKKMSSKKEAPPPPLPASILKKYKFRREIGQGSYGTVW